ncbi:PaaX family transcriptional regulator C-terminal domain-containing protein [uncultured Nocardioides sp.]|uniref:PaaX family transcriptional regulator n=1 Tax=uncultured Nocardioides sp. TaxID=198441 RepID=UPI0026062943|nr:PaaX family transcriptional regulator C-terminal domain-containing protein [uncultured Nocardioides sp.]
MATPRSLILDLFGDYLRYTDAEVRLGHLTSLLGDFGVAPATVRVTLSRLRREGWFTSRREGRETVYTLSDEMLGVLDEGRRRIFAPPAVAWDGGWTMVIYQLSEAERAERDELRKRLAWLGFGSLSTSTWLAPGERTAEVDALDAVRRTDRVDVLRCRSRGLEHDRDLARRCWDLDDLATQYDAFVAQHRDLEGRAGDLTGADALVARTDLIATFRHFPFLDPRLPEQVRPDGWPGEEAHRLFADVHRRLGPPAREHVAAVVGRSIESPDV